MTTKTAVVGAFAASLGLLACASDEQATSMPPVIDFECPGGSLVEGDNTLIVDGVTRSFHAQLPDDITRPMGVVFSWHGFTDTGAHHRAIAGLDPNADPSLPVLVITPEDTDIQPPLGLDWDIGRGKPGDANVDLPFFEAMLGCANEQLPIDSARIYSFGFSAGSVFTALLHSRYPKLLSAVVAESGAWFNDPTQADLVNVIDVEWSWPALDPADEGAVLLTHGGPTDVTVLNVLDLEASAQAAIPFLRQAQRTVIDCPHALGHALHPELDGAALGAFFSAHRAAERSSVRVAGELPGALPASCTLRLPE